MKSFQFKKSGVLVFSVCFLVFASLGEAADIPDPEKWYVESYAPIWREVTTDTASEAGHFYHSQILVHNPDGEVITHDSATWLADSVTEWIADGWTGSQVPDIRVNRINESTTSFIARYLDHYEGGTEEYTCGWYLADLIDGQWKFTHYAETACVAHGF